MQKSLFNRSEKLIQDKTEDAIYRLGNLATWAQLRLSAELEKISQGECGGWSELFNGLLERTGPAAMKYAALERVAEARLDEYVATFFPATCAN